MLGLYLYDYGDGRRMPKDLMELQCETARRLAHAGRIQGIVFLSIDNDADAVNWMADWIKRVGDEPVGKQAQSRRVPAKTVAMSQQADSPTLGPHARRRRPVALPRRQGARGPRPTA